jgi:hypothetical protein
MAQAIKVTQSQNGNTTSNDQRAMSLQIRETGQNVTTNVFVPFDQIQLYANVTYGNTAQPDISAPAMVETSVSFFSLLLVATGLFTFILLFMFLKRKTKI